MCLVPNKVGKFKIIPYSQGTHSNLTRPSSGLSNFLCTTDGSVSDADVLISQMRKLRLCLGSTVSCWQTKVSNLGLLTASSLQRCPRPCANFLEWMDLELEKRQGLRKSWQNILHMGMDTPGWILPYYPG